MTKHDDISIFAAAAAAGLRQPGGGKNAKPKDRYKPRYCRLSTVVRALGPTEYKVAARLNRARKPAQKRSGGVLATVEKRISHGLPLAAPIAAIELAALIGCLFWMSRLSSAFGTFLQSFLWH